MKIPDLAELEKEASSEGFLLRIQVRRPLNIWAIRVVIAEKTEPNKLRIWGEMKGWAYRGVKGLQLDTMQVNRMAPPGIGHIVWAATMAWALEATPCKCARLLAIYDSKNQNDRLVKYFNRRKFKLIKEVGSSPLDLPLRLIWGGAGSLMSADCSEVLMYSYLLWQKARF